MKLTVEVYSEKLGEILDCEVRIEFSDNPDKLLGEEQLMDFEILALYNKKGKPIRIKYIKEEDAIQAACLEIQFQRYVDGRNNDYIEMS
ncbi:MAG: hypothetical protein K1X66_02290 [Verrucomicrobiae bacterium]|nr:hypothetical protein [Verrucomicrobiae bacterium]